MHINFDLLHLSLLLLLFVFLLLDHLEKSSYNLRFYCRDYHMSVLTVVRLQ